MGEQIKQANQVCEIQKLRTRDLVRKCIARSLIRGLISCSQKHVASNTELQHILPYGGSFGLPTYQPTYLVPFFFSSFLPCFRTSYPPGGRYTSTLTPLLAPARKSFWRTGLLATSFFDTNFRTDFCYHFGVATCFSEAPRGTPKSDSPPALG